MQKQREVCLAGCSTDMEMINSQLLYFLASFLWGVFLMFLYDWLRIFRKLIPHRLAVTTIEDVLFWLVSSIFVFQMIFERNNGIPRIFFIVAFAGGMIAYTVLAGERFVNMIAGLIRKILHPIIKGGKKVAFFVKNLLKKDKKSLIMKTRRKLQR